MNHGNPESTAREASMPSENDTRGRYKCVADVMTRKTVTLSPHHGFAEAVSLMADRHFRHGPRGVGLRYLRRFLLQG